MKRRTALASLGSLLGASAAGCLSDGDASGPAFALRDVRSYSADPGTAVVVGRVEKRGSDAGSVTIRAELLVEDAHDHASAQTFVVAEDVESRAVAVPFTSDSSFYGEHAFTARAKIVRRGEPGGEWVTET